MLGSKISNAAENNNFAFFYACEIKKGGYGRLQEGEREPGRLLTQDYVLS